MDVMARRERDDLVEVDWLIELPAKLVERIEKDARATGYPPGRTVRALIELAYKHSDELDAQKSQ